jgi:hypothetical protein
MKSGSQALFCVVQLAFCSRIDVLGVAGVQHICELAVSKLFYK